MQQIQNLNEYQIKQGIFSRIANICSLKQIYQLALSKSDMIDDANKFQSIVDGYVCYNFN